MSTGQILEEIKSYPTSEIESLEHELRLERLRRTRRGLSAQETRLFEIINQPTPDHNRYQELTPSWEAGTLADEERAELLAIIEQREKINACRVEAVIELAQLRGVPFDGLWRQIMGAPPQPRVILD